MRSFFDTNILVYAQGPDGKGEAARSLIGKGGVISAQVLNEFANVLRRKLQRSWADIAAATEDILILLPKPLPLTVETHLAARELSCDHGFAFYDALIVAAALGAGCERLISEDLQAGRKIGRLEIINPFV